jgi:hypothetical protein
VLNICFVARSNSLISHPASSARSDPHTLELNCLVRGDGTDHVFTAEITNTKNVSALRKAIKEEKKHTFEHVDADSLVLWNVSIPVNDDFQENVKKLDLRDEEALSPVEDLSRVFVGEPTRKKVHVIVKAPDVGAFELIECLFPLKIRTSLPNLTCLPLRPRLLPPRPLPPPP